MGQYVIRRILTAIPTLIFISFVIFALLDLAPATRPPTCRKASHKKSKNGFARRLA